MAFVLILLLCCSFFTYSMKRNLLFTDPVADLLPLDFSGLKEFLESDHGTNLIDSCKEASFTIMTYIHVSLTKVFKKKDSDIIESIKLLYEHGLPFVDPKIAEQQDGYFGHLLKPTFLAFCKDTLSKDDMLFFLNEQFYHAQKVDGTYFLRIVMQEHTWQLAKELYKKYKQQGLLFSTGSFPLNGTLFHYLMQYYFAVQTYGLEEMTSKRDNGYYLALHQEGTDNICKRVQFFMLHALTEDFNKKNDLGQTPREYYGYLLNILAKYTNDELFNKNEQVIWSDCVDRFSWMLKPDVLKRYENAEDIILLWQKTLPMFEQLWTDAHFENSSNQHSLLMLRNREITGKRNNL